MKIIISIGILLLFTISCQENQKSKSDFSEISAEQLRDKIRGGLLGQILGNLNGIPHEMQYIEEPGNVQNYTPSLPNGARTDDDTDFEWVYVKVMQDENTIFLSPDRLTELWKERINRGIWCSNRYSRYLMDLGIKPPLTSNFVLNPWADFNISGQFICETFGLMAPGMPQTASRIGLNYTRITIDLEPAQTTQLFCTMISTAFFSDEIQMILDAGLEALDPKSEIRNIITDVRNWYIKYPEDWRMTRRLVQEKYTRFGGKMRDRNGFELNTAATIAALLYGQGDFIKTLVSAFNFGWDADNTAATAGTIVGVIKGYRWMMSQGWQIVDRYHNTKRENMPEDETITSFADRVIDLAEKVIVKNGGKKIYHDG
ncbi:MAG: ADP-ribosylglycohydrolase family protein, partial [Anaerolineales bacterium]